MSVICVIFALCGCAGFNNSSVPAGEKETGGNGSHWISRPSPDSLVIFGVSGRQLKQETEIENACADAARKIALYHGVRGIHNSVQNIGSGFLDYYVDSNTVLEYDSELEKYQEKLVFDAERDVIVIDGAVFVRFTYPAVFPGRLDYSFGKNSNGYPVWINRPPSRIGEFYAGVGFSGRQYRMRDTITKSYEDAIVSIISQISTAVTTEMSSIGYQNQSLTYRQSEGRLTHFLVLETWIDPASGDVWTLAVARSAN